jgi:hypothetical protein
MQAAGAEAHSFLVCQTPSAALKALQNKLHVQAKLFGYRMPGAALMGS